MNIKFKLDRETKNTVRYAEDGPEHKVAIGMLYVKKIALEALTKSEDWPSVLYVTVSTEKGK